MLFPIKYSQIPYFTQFKRGNNWFIKIPPLRCETFQETKNGVGKVSHTFKAIKTFEKDHGKDFANGCYIYTDVPDENIEVLIEYDTIDGLKKFLDKCKIDEK